MLLRQCCSVVFYFIAFAHASCSSSFNGPPDDVIFSHHHSHESPNSEMENDDEDDFCWTAISNPGQCVVIHRCPHLQNLLKQPRPENIRFLKKSGCGFDGKTPKVCCPIMTDRGATIRPPIQTKPTKPPLRPTTPSTRLPTTSGRPLVPPPPTVGRPPATNPPGRNNPPRGTLVPPTVNPSLFPPECGLPGLGSRIRGGTTSQIAEYPWMAALAYNVAGRGAIFQCGGFLINRRYVLTAAHCVQDKDGRLRNLAFVRLGDHDLSRNDEGAEPLDLLVEQIVTHDNYSRNPSIINDIALLRLSKDVQYNTFIAPICLPFPTHSPELYAGLNVTVAGWGSDGVFPGVPQLQSVTVPIIDNEQCRKRYSEIKVIVNPSNHICAAAPGKDSCTGDSGGPLMVREEGEGKLPRFVAIGVLSFGGVRCNGTVPGVYTNTKTLLPWITDFVRV